MSPRRSAFGSISENQTILLVLLVLGAIAAFLFFSKNSASSFGQTQAEKILENLDANVDAATTKKEEAFGIAKQQFIATGEASQEIQKKIADLGSLLNKFVEASEERAAAIVRRNIMKEIIKNSILKQSS